MSLRNLMDAANAAGCGPPPGARALADALVAADEGPQERDPRCTGRCCDDGLCNLGYDQRPILDEDDEDDARDPDDGNLPACAEDDTRPCIANVLCWAMETCLAKT